MNATGYLVSEDEPRWSSRLASPRLGLGKLPLQKRVNAFRRRYMDTVSRDLRAVRNEARA